MKDLSGVMVVCGVVMKCHWNVGDYRLNGNMQNRQNFDVCSNPPKIFLFIIDGPPTKDLSSLSDTRTKNFP